MTPATTTEPVRPGATSSLGSGRREARLRPEHADRYPGQHAISERGRRLPLPCPEARALQRGRDTALWVRVLLDEHFEFRGGGGHRATEDGRPRREDR